MVTSPITWDELGTSENLYNASTACSNPNYVPVPTISLSGPSCLSLQRAQNGQQPPQLFTATTNASNGQFRHIWSVSAAGQPAVVTTSNSFTFYLSAPGNYTVTVTRQDINNPGITRSATTTYTVIDCDILSGTSSNCDWLEGDFVTQLANSQNVFAHFSNGTLYASTDNGAFVSRSTLQANGLFGEFADCFAVTDPRSGGVISLPNGCYTIKAKHSNKFMQPENGNNGARIRQYSGNGQSNQVFELEGVDSDAYKIKAWGTNRVWEAAGAGTGSGTAVRLWDYNGGNHQKWLVSDWGDGTYRLAPKHQQTIIADVEGQSTSDGAGLHIWGQHAENNQRFYFNSTGCPGGGNPCSNPPGAPSLSATANPINAGQSTTLTATGCPGTVNWNTPNGSPTVSPATTTTYTATCTVNGCTSAQGNVTITVNGTPPPVGSCSAVNDQCSSSQNETHNYTVSVPSAGNYTLQVNYRSYQGPGGIIRWSVNAGAVSTTGVGQTGIGDYQDANLGSAYLNAGSNTVTLSSGALFVCFRKVCANSGGARLGVIEEPTTDSPELTVSPNPNDGAFEARFYVEPGRKATLRVSDIQGREVWKKSLTGAGEHREPVRLPAQSVGTFILLLDKEATDAKGKADRRPADRRPTEIKRVIVVK